MKLSVVIPVYNAESYIEQCLESVCTQSISDMEIICIDDASTDRSAEIVQECQRRDARIRLIKNEKNLFAGACRNIGIEAAKGEYIHFLDADDLVEEGAYSCFYDLAKSSDADVIKGKSNNFDHVTGEVSTTPLLDLAQIPEEIFGKIITFHDNPELFSHISVVPWNGLYKTSFLKNNKIFFNHLICVNDRSFFNEVTVKAQRILLVTENLVRYRINNNQSLVGGRARNFYCQFESYDIVREQCNKIGIQGKELKVILDRELIDLFIWYRRFKKIQEIRDDITDQMVEFIKKLDMEPFKNETMEPKWYYDYLLLKEESVLTVAVHLDGDVSLIDSCLTSIQNQSVGKFIVYGIGSEELYKSIFDKYRERDERFIGICTDMESVPWTTPYLFETYPKIFQKKSDFKNYLFKIMRNSHGTDPERQVLYQSEGEKKGGIFKRVLRKCKRIVKRIK